MQTIIVGREAKARTLTVKSLDELKPEDVTKSYSGRPGCGCGCRGKYSSTRSAIARVLLAMKAEELDPTSDAQKVGAMTADEDICYFVETESRYRWLYVPAKNALVPGQVEFGVGDRVTGELFDSGLVAALGTREELREYDSSGAAAELPAGTLCAAVVLVGERSNEVYVYQLDEVWTTPAAVAKSEVLQ